MANGKRAGIEQVPCAVCLREIPRDEAQVAEAEDYVLYFCGIDCYGKWRTQEDVSGSDSEIQVQQRNSQK